MEGPFQHPIHWPRSNEDSKEKEGGKKREAALEPPLQPATRVEGDEAAKRRLSRKNNPASRDMGEENKKNRTFFNLHAFRKVKAVTTGGTGKNGL